MRSSPVDLNRLYWHKFLGLLAVVLLVGETLVVVSGRVADFNLYLVILAVMSMAFVALTLTSLHMGGGAYYANYKERNAIRVASSQGASLTFLLSIFYVLVMVSILWIATNQYFENLILRKDPPSMWFSWPVAFIGLISLLASIATLWLGVRSFKRDF